MTEALTCTSRLPDASVLIAVEQDFVAVLPRSHSQALNSPCASSGPLRGSWE